MFVIINRNYAILQQPKIIGYSLQHISSLSTTKG